MKFGLRQNILCLTTGLTICILFVGWFVRLHNLLIFPPFLDEADHIFWARDVYTFHPFTGAANGKLFGLWWIAVFNLNGNGALFVARAGTALFSMLVIAVVYSLGRYFGSTNVGLVGAIAYSVAPFAFFFDRLALVDSYVMVWGVLSLWFVVRFTKNGHVWDALFCGITLVGAILAKATGVMLTVLPGIAILLLTPHWEWRKRLRGLAWSYGTLMLFWFPFYWFLRWRGYNYFSTATSVVGTGQVTGIVNRIINNFQSAAQIDGIYLGMPLLAIAFVLLTYVMIRKVRLGLFLLLTLLFPLAGLLAFATRLSTRYIQFHVPFLILGIVVGGGLLVSDLYRLVRLPRWLLPYSLLIVWCITISLPFITHYWIDARSVILPPYDREEYVRSDASGFALPEVSSYLQSTVNNQSALVIGLLPNCRGLDLLVPEHHSLTVECPYILLDGSNQSKIAAHVNQLAVKARSTFQLWIVLDNLVPYVSLEGITAPLETVGVFQRPDGATYITLYRLVQ